MIEHAIVSRAPGYGHEKKDCVVRALASCAGIRYEEAHREARLAGRVDGRGTPWDAVYKLFNRFGKCTHTRVQFAKFMRAHPQGTYAVWVRGHIFAVIDGVVQDTSPPKPGWIVQGYWTVKEAEPIERPAPVAGPKSTAAIPPHLLAIMQGKVRAASVPR